MKTTQFLNLSISFCEISGGKCFSNLEISLSFYFKVIKSSNYSTTQKKKKKKKKKKNCYLYKKKKKKKKNFYFLLYNSKFSLFFLELTPELVASYSDMLSLTFSCSSSSNISAFAIGEFSY